MRKPALKVSTIKSPPRQRESLLAGRTTSHPASPAAEIPDRWQRREFVLLYSLDTLTEYAEKLLSRGIAPMDAETFIRLLVLHAEIVPVASFRFRH